jgi:shikimate kinase
MGFCHGADAESGQWYPKSCFSQRTAEQLGLDFVDSDHELEARTGASVSLIFDVEGEAGFRARETKMLERLTRRQGVLLATGGGVVTEARNRELLSQNGIVVYLRTSVAQQLKRLSRDRSRPLLQTENRRERLERLAEERNPLYQELADIEFPSQNRSPEVSARRLAERIREHLQQTAAAGDRSHA